MLGKLFGLGDGGVRYPELAFRGGWPAWVVALLALAAAAFAFYIYLREDSLSRRRRVVFAVMRSALYAALIVLLFEPVFSFETDIKMRRSVLVLLDLSESMNIRDPRRNEAEVAEAALALGKIPYPARQEKTTEGKEEALPAETLERAKALDPGERKKLAEASRLELAKGMLANAETKLGRRLGEEFEVRYFAFGEKLRPTEGDGERLPADLQSYAAEEKFTSLGSMIDEAVSRYSGQTIAGVVAITDGASNNGADPREVAARLGKAGIPVFPVSLGLPKPQDIAVRDLIVQEVVFKDDKVPVRVQLNVNGYRGRSADLVVRLNGAEAARKTLTLGDGTMFAEIELTADKAGEAKLEAQVGPLEGETATDNNALARNLKVVDEKIDVLYMEGKPRWEYRYLRQVLLKDKRLRVHFVMTEGDPELPRVNKMYLPQFPADAKEADAFDLVIVGDVNPTNFTPKQMERLDDLVLRRGGSFLMIAGHQYAPKNYRGTALEKLLPVKLGGGDNRIVPPTVHPVITPDGARSSIMRLDYPDEKNQSLWALVAPMYELPVLERPKPAAIVLANLSEEAGVGKDYPLVCWQRYGSGKTMFVATDQLWRLRFKRGDKYHARFWGQAIQFLTLSRLLGKNRRVSIELGKPEYRAGERVQIYASAVDESYAPLIAPSFPLLIKAKDPALPAVDITLQAVAGSPGMYEGFATLDKPGGYTVTARPGEEDTANAADFEVLDVSLERAEMAMQQELLDDIASLSGGRRFSAVDLPALPEAIGGKNPVATVRRKIDLWDNWAVFLAILTVVGAEWFLRRRNNLT